MKQLILPIVLLVGCAGNTITTPHGVVIDQSFNGRGCIAVQTNSETTNIIVQQDGTSDWSLFRSLEFLGDAAGAVFGGERRADQRGPDGGVGCEGLFIEEKPEPGPQPIIIELRNVTGTNTQLTPAGE